MGYDTIHETIIKDITDIIRDGIDISRDISNSSKGAGYASSLTKATKGLVMEFPVLISKANHIESAGIVAKAYEAKFVTLLHMAFVASNITNSQEGLEYIKNFHTNLDSGKLSVDDFMGLMDNFVESSNTITASDYAKYKAVTEDMKNLCYCFGDDISESSLHSYKVMNNYGNIKVVKEADDDNFLKKIANSPNNGLDDLTSTELIQYQQFQKLSAEVNALLTVRRPDGSTYLISPEDQKRLKQLDLQIKKLDHETTQEYLDRLTRKQRIDIQHTHQQIKRIMKQNDIDDKQYQLAVDKFTHQKVMDNERLTRDRLRDDKEDAKRKLDMLATGQNMITNYIVPSDLKKANELVPTMMVVNFIYQPEYGGEAQYRQMVVGVKAKLYEVEPMDVINKIITKHVDSNILLKLVQVNTRQISFVKDFLFAIDSAKVDALSKSRRGSTNKLFKVLERRALGSRASKVLRTKDYCKAITSLVISQEEAEELKKNNIDVTDAKVIRNIMEQLNLISFAIIDESAESVKFIFDTGDDVYETIPLGKLEKEQKDGMSKKVINLMAKMNR